MLFWLGMGGGGGGDAKLEAEFMSVCLWGTIKAINLLLEAHCNRQMYLFFTYFLKKKSFFLWLSIRFCRCINIDDDKNCIINSYF